MEGMCLPYIGHSAGLLRRGNYRRGYLGRPGVRWFLRLPYVGVARPARVGQRL